MAQRKHHFVECLQFWMNEYDEYDEYEGSFVCKLSSSVSQIFTANVLKIEILYLRSQRVSKLHFQNLKVVGLMREKFYFFLSLGIQIEIAFHPTNTKIKIHSFIALK